MESTTDRLMRTEGGHTGILGSNFSEVTGDGQDKTARRNCLTPECFPYSRDRARETRDEAQSSTFKELRHTSKPRAQELSDLPKKEASSSDAESDFYDGNNLSCTPERMDYPDAQGNERSLCCCVINVPYCGIHSFLSIRQSIYMYATLLGTNIGLTVILRTAAIVFTKHS